MKPPMCINCKYGVRDLNRSYSCVECTNKDKHQAENVLPGYTLWAGRHREGCEFWERKPDARLVR